MPAAPHNPSSNTTVANVPMPRLCDDAVVQIHNFIEHFLDLFEAHYGDQIHRYYEERAAHNLTTPPCQTSTTRRSEQRPHHPPDRRRQLQRCRRFCSCHQWASSELLKFTSLMDSSHITKLEHRNIESGDHTQYRRIDCQRSEIRVTRSAPLLTSHGLRLTKRLLREGQHMRLDSSLELSAAFQALAHNTEDHLEAVNALLDKRPAHFKWPLRPIRRRTWPARRGRRGIRFLDPAMH